MQKKIKLTLFSFIKKYGKPDFLFIMLPDLDRSIYFDRLSGKYVNALAVPVVPKDSEGKRMAQPWTEYSETYKKEQIVLEVSVMMSMLESFCNESGIVLRWLTWDQECQDVLCDLGFEKNVKIDKKEILKIKNTKTLPYWETASDGNHFGSQFSTYVSEIIMESLLNENY